MNKIITFIAAMLISAAAIADVNLSGRWQDYFEEGDSYRTDFTGVTITTRQPSAYAGAYVKTGLMTWDVSNTTLVMTVKASDWDAVKTMSILVGHGLKFDNAATADLRSRIFGSPNEMWVTVAIPPSMWSVEGTVDWSAVDSFLVKVNDTGDKRVMVQVKDVKFVSNKMTAPRITITVDDGLSDTMIVVDELARRGWAGTMFIDHEKIGDNGYITMSDLFVSAQHGWDIGGHRIGRITQLTPEEFDLFATTQLDYVNVLRGGKPYFALPNGATSVHHSEVLARRYTHVFAITGMASNASTAPSQYINRHSIDKHTSLKLAQKWVDDAIANNEWIIINFHTFSDTWEREEDWSRDDLVSLLDYIKERGLSVEPVSKVLQ